MVICIFFLFLFCLVRLRVWRCEVHIGLAFILNLQISKRLRHVVATLDGSLGRTGWLFFGCVWDGMVGMCGKITIVNVWWIDILDVGF